MTIQFLKPCMVNQNKVRYCCEMCGEIPDGAEMTWFDKDEIVENCDNWDRRVDLTVLKFGVDYIITEYP
jgi:ArsR family metal-binding transcriptional regulator